MIQTSQGILSYYRYHGKVHVYYARIYTHIVRAKEKYIESREGGPVIPSTGQMKYTSLMYGFDMETKF